MGAKPARSAFLLIAGALCASLITACDSSPPDMERRAARDDPGSTGSNAAGTGPARAGNSAHVSSFTAGGRQYLIEFGHGLAIHEVRVADGKNIEFLQDVARPIMETDDERDIITEVKGATWLNDGIVLAFTMKIARTGRSQHFWATTRKGDEWAVQKLALTNEPEESPFTIRDVFNEPQMGDSIMILLGRVLPEGESYSVDMLWYQHDCPIFTSPDDGAGKYYRFHGMKEFDVTHEHRSGR